MRLLPSSTPRRLWRDRRGTAAAEMALVTPLLMVLMFGSFELGNYFLDSHVVAKAVRDGARFAGRQSFPDMPCGAASAVEADIKDIVRKGSTVDSDTTAPPRLWYWTNPATITVTTTCDSSGTYSAAGIYTGVTGGARRVTVSAAVPYDSLFGIVGFETTINAVSRSAVMGI